MQTRQLSLDEAIIPDEKVETVASAISGILNDQIAKFDPEKKICHGIPMRRVELSPGRYAWRCDECQTLMVQAK